MFGTAINNQLSSKIEKNKFNILTAIDEENGQEFGDDGAKNDEMEKDLDKVEPKPLRPIFLVAIPSFYEQDLKRIKLVQAELMASSMREHAIHRLEDVTQEFNQCTYF